MLVFLGGGIGAVARHSLVLLLTKMLGHAFPYGVFFVNTLGCFVMGILIGFMSFSSAIGEGWRSFLIIGILGGFTTFSSFAADILLLFERGELMLSIAYLVGSVLFSMLLLVAGMHLSKGLLNFLIIG